MLLRRAGLHHLRNVRQAVNSRLPVFLLDETKITVWLEFRVASYEEVDARFEVEFVHNSPGPVPHHEVVFVLSSTIVTVKLHLLFPHPVVLEEMVEVTDHAVRSLPGLHTFINEIVDLLLQSLTAYPEQAAFPWRDKINGTRLKHVMWILHVLGVVECVVDSHVFAGWGCWAKC